MPEQFLPPVFSAQMQRIVAPLVPQAEVVEQGDRATLTPRGMGGMTNASGQPEGDMGPMFQMALTKTDGVWRVRLQDSAELFKMSLDGSARAQAEQTAAENPEVEAVAVEIGQGKHKTAEEAWKALRAGMEKADDAVRQRWMAARTRPATQPATQR